MAFQSVKFGVPILVLLVLVNIAVLVLVMNGIGVKSNSKLLLQLDQKYVYFDQAVENDPTDFFDIWETLAAMVPSAPVDFMKFMISKDNREKNQKCQWFPRPSDLFIVNEHWQLLHLDFEAYLYSAHYDDRGQQSSVRIITMIDR